MLGTGFFIRPDTVVTCAHVLTQAAGTLPAQVRGRLAPDGRPVMLATSPDRCFRDEDTGLDLALLRLVDDADVQPVLLSAVVAVGDPLWTYGHPDGRFRAGQPATFTYEGESRRSMDEPLTLGRLRGTPVGGGFSGSPVVNRRTGAVCGMLCTSDKAGSAHMLSVTDILARAAPQADLPRAWLGTLTDTQVRAGGWPFAGPRLRDYLAAAARAARAHPYPGVLPGVSPPPLSTVYLRQQALEQTAEDSAGTGLPLPADAILTGDRDVLLVGGPGAGKSSLLRMGVMTLAPRFGQDTTLVPVLVTAADLATGRPLPDAVADAVRVGLRDHGLVRDWPAEFFREPPAPNCRWLVLVDGLDEVADATRRKAVLDALAGVREVDPAADVWRFVVTTRPLSKEELTRFRDARRYELMPFHAEDLPDFAVGWLTALAVPDPAAAAERFAAQVNHGGPRGLATVPLMATMLCQLFAADVDGPLPTGRYAVYEAFVRLLHDRQYAEAAGAAFRQIRAATDRYGSEVTSAAEQLHTRAGDLVARLALARHEGRLATAVDLLAEWTDDLRPPHLAAAVWRTLLRDDLRRNGLLVEHGEDFVFIHQTIEEFLAATQVAADERRSASAFRQLFGRWPRGRRGRVEPDSFTRFLLAATHDRPEVEKALRRRAGRRETFRDTGVGFLGPLAADGVRLPPSVMRRAVTTLWTAVTDERLTNYDRFKAARALADLGDARGTTILADMAGEPTGQVRVWAAEAMAKRGDVRGNEILLTIARTRATERDMYGNDHTLHTRMEAVQALRRLGDRRERDVLVGINAEPDLNVDERIRVALELAGTGDPRGADVLAEIATGEGFDLRHWREAAQELANLGDPRGAEALWAIAADRDRDLDDREHAAHELGTLGDVRGNDILVEIATTPTGAIIDDLNRWGSAESLGRLGDPRYADVLAAVVGDNSLVHQIRAWADKELARLGDPRHRGLKPPYRR